MINKVLKTDITSIVVLGARPFKSQVILLKCSPTEVVSYDYNQDKYVLLATASYFKTDSVL